MPFITSISLILDTVLNRVQLDWNTLYPMKEYPMEEWDAEDLKRNLMRKKSGRLSYLWLETKLQVLMDILHSLFKSFG